MRIVAVADTHLFTDDLVVPDGDVFVHAGDLCRAGTLDELARAAEWIRALPHRRKVVIAGNHDWSFVREPARARALLGDDVTYLEGEAAEVGGLRFWGGPWQPEFNAWAFNLPRGAALAEKWSAIPAGLDVLVTHGPPEGIGDQVRDERRTGDADLLTQVLRAKPRLHLFGHIHQDGGFWERDGVRFANVTTWECERPPTVIDVDASSIRAISVPPAG